MKDAVVFTTTFYNDTPEGVMRKNLALEFAATVVNQDYPLVVLDGGTDDGRFIEELRYLGAQAYAETRHGLPGSRREALHHAYQFAVGHGLSIVNWSEPEKIGYPQHLDYLVERMKESSADLIVPRRRSMRSYPEAQEFSERFGNQLHTDKGYVDLHGKPLDQFYGPHMWKKSMTPYFQIFDDPKVAEVLAEVRITEAEKEYKVTLGPELRAFEKLKASRALGLDHMMHMPTSLMILRGQKVLSVEVDYTHPAAQTTIETVNQAVWNEKRLKQLNALAEQFKLVRILHEKGILEEKIKKELGQAA